MFYLAIFTWCVEPHFQSLTQKRMNNKIFGGLVRRLTQKYMLFVCIRGQICTHETCVFLPRKSRPAPRASRRISPAEDPTRSAPRRARRRFLAEGDVFGGVRAGARPSG